MIPFTLLNKNVCQKHLHSGQSHLQLMHQQWIDCYTRSLQDLSVVTSSQVANGAITLTQLAAHSKHFVIVMLSQFIRHPNEDYLIGALVYSNVKPSCDCVICRQWGPTMEVKVVGFFHPVACNHHMLDQTNFKRIV